MKSSPHPTSPTRGEETFPPLMGGTKGGCYIQYAVICEKCNLYMHELFFIKDLVQKIISIAREQQASKVVSVTVKLGALSHVSPDHFREHFVHASHGTLAEGAQLNILVMTDVTDPQSQDVLLENIEVVE